MENVTLNDIAARLTEKQVDEIFETQLEVLKSTDELNKHEAFRRDNESKINQSNNDLHKRSISMQDAQLELFRQGNTLHGISVACGVVFTIVITLCGVKYLLG